jgi:hypothetical protein
MDFGLWIVLEWPDERAACLAEDLTIVAFWSSDFTSQKGANFFALWHSVK